MNSHQMNKTLELTAPRQALFAFILLISFVLTSALLVYSLSNKESVERKIQGKQLTTQISNNIENYIIAKDKVGLSLYIKRYINLPYVNNIRITNEHNEILTELGASTYLQGDVYSENVLVENNSVGTVNIIMQQSNLGDLVKSQWVVFIGTAFLHLVLFCIYNLIARQFVVREMIPVRNRLQKQTDLVYADEAMFDTNNHGSHQAHLEDDMLDYVNDDQQLPSLNKMEQDVISNTSNYLNQNNTNTPNIKEPVFGLDDDEYEANTKNQQSVDTNNSFTMSRMSAINHMRLNIQFDDPRTLLPKLTVGIVKPYYQLCDTLLDKAIEELSDSNIMPAQVSFDKVNFSAQGVTVTALSENKENAAFACFLLGQLYFLLHQVTYSKHIEIKRFALPCKACICNNQNITTLANLLDTDAGANAMMLLLNKDESANFVGQVEMRSFTNPQTVLQRHVGIIEAVNQNIVQTLTVIRNSILNQ